MAVKRARPPKRQGLSSSGLLVTRQGQHDREYAAIMRFWQCKRGLVQEMEQSNLEVGRKFFLTKSTGTKREIEGLRTLPQRFAVQGNHGICQVT